MDPEKPLGFARTLLSFLSSIRQQLGSSKVVLNGPERSPGAANAPEVSTTSLEAIYDDLIKQHYGQFEADVAIPGRQAEEWWTNVWAFNDVAGTCREVFDELKALLDNIQQSNTNAKRWPNFRQAIESLWYKNEIATFEKKCNDSWDILTEHICAFSRYWVGMYQNAYNKLRETNLKQRQDVPEHFRNQIGYSPQFEAMARLVNDTLACIASVEASRSISLEPLDLLLNNFNALYNTERSVSGEHIIIDTLAFHDYDTQFKLIPSVVSPMFKWIFSSPDGPGSPRSGSDLNKWLRQGYGIGLVTGDSGSGKSMLMKHVATHPDLDGSLYQWSNPKPVIIASHFFCKTGTPLQRSRQGMLRTLLRSVLLQMPGDIAPIYRGLGLRHPEHLRDHSWTADELEGHLLNVLRSHNNLKFCFFIDGLDQCEDDFATLIPSLQTLVRTGNGKLCLSSSSDHVKDFFSVPLTRFSIGGGFLRKDLEIYIRDRLKSMPWYRDKASTTQQDGIARMTADKYGNFLWARMAVEYLRSHCRGIDTFQSLTDSIHNLPSHPTELVKRYLRAIPAALAQSSAYFFLVALAAKNPPPFAVFQFLLSEQNDPDYALKLTPQALTSDKQKASLHAVQEALEKRCGKLLQIRPDLRVDFPHATIKEIFTGSDLLTSLRTKASPKNNVHLSLARAYLGYMKTTKLSWGRPTYAYTYLPNPSFSKIFGEFLAIARDLDGDLRMHYILDNWETCFESKSKTDQQQLEEKNRVNVTLAQHFQRPILDALLTGYVNWKLLRHPKFLDAIRETTKFPRMPALSLVLKSMFEAHGPRREEHIPMLRCLLQRGCDPNETYQSIGSTCTPWTDLIRRAASPEEFKWSLNSGIFSLFLQNRTDPNTPVWNSHPSIFGLPRRCYTNSWVLLVFFMTQMLRRRDVILSEADHRACLSVMDGLRARGASADSHPSYDFFNSPYPDEDTGWAKSLLEDLFDSQPRGPPAAHSLRAGLAERILLILISSGYGVDWSWEIAQQHLPQSMFDTIKDKVLKAKDELESRSVSVPGSPNTGKRSLDDLVTESETSPKRPRSEPEDETMTMTMTMRVESGPA